MLETGQLRLEELWAHPPRCATTREGIRGHLVRGIRDDGKESEVRQARMTAVVDQDVGLGKSALGGKWATSVRNSYPL